MDELRKLRKEIRAIKRIKRDEIRSASTPYRVLRKKNDNSGENGRDAGLAIIYHAIHPFSLNPTEFRRAVEFSSFLEVTRVICLSSFGVRWTSKLCSVQSIACHEV